MKSFIQEFVKKLSEKDLNTYAASAAFFLFLSFLPIVILLLLTLPLTGLGAEELISMVTDVTPSFIDGLVTQLIQEAYSRTAGLVPLSVIVIIFSAAQGMNALICGLRLVYDLPRQKNILYLNLLGLISTLAIIVFLILSALGLVLSNAAIHAAGADAIEIPVFAALVLRLRYLIMLALFIVLLTLLYTFVSGSKRNPRLHIPGAVFSSVACAIFTGIFSVFVRFNRNYHTIYGSIASFVVMMLWAYICIYLILIGGCLNHLLLERKSHQKSEESSS